MEHASFFAAGIVAGIALSSPASAQCTSLSTTYASNNGGSSGGQVFVDVQVLTASGITVTSLDTNTGAAVGTGFDLDVYTIAGTYVGSETNAGAWSLVSSGSGVAAGTNTPSSVDVADFTLAQGSYGVALVMSSTAGHKYTGTSGSTPLPPFANADLSITTGAALNAPWTGAPFTPRAWNGALAYCPATPPTPTVYCTAGTSTNGCIPQISASAQPSASFATTCLVTVTNVEGGMSGILFYGVSNGGFTPLPWSSTGTSTSFMCVRKPLQRANVQYVGGNFGQCDGVLVLDWNVLHAASPGLLGAPFSAGGKLYVQGWYLDPPAPRGTNLSDAVELTCVP